MSRKSALRNVAAIVVAGAYAVLLASTPSVYAQVGSPPSGNSAHELAVSQRLILHDINVNGTVVAPDSRPVLDYAVRILQQYPATRVYVSGQGDRATVDRQAQAVARYLERSGISANRLTLQEPGTGIEKNASTRSRTSGVIVLNLTTPGCSTCSS